MIEDNQLFIKMINKEINMKGKKSKFLLLLFSIILSFGMVACSSDDNNSSDAVPPPGKPANFTATDGVYRDRVVLAWDGVDDAESYSVYKAMDKDSDYRQVATDITESTYSDDTISITRPYFYKVVGVNSGGEGVHSDSDQGSANPLLPAVVTGLSATTDENLQVSLTWSGVVDTDSYVVYRSESVDGTYSQIVRNITDLTYTDEDVIPKTSYFYKISGVNIDGEGEMNNAVEGSALPEIADVPGNILASQGLYGNKVVITWDAAERAETYTVYRADTVDGTYIELVNGLNSLTYEDSSAIDGLSYFYKVTAVNEGGESDLDSAVAAEGSVDSNQPSPPTAPVNLTATGDQFDAISISWDEVTGADTYTLLRSDSADGTYTEIAAGIVYGGLPYADSSVDFYVAYYYKVKAVNADGESESSDYTEGTAFRTPPEIPTGLSATDGQTGNITITWSAADRAATYSMYRSETNGDDFVLIAENLIELTFHDNTIIPIYDYYYKILAVNPGGQSDLSTSDSGSAILGVPDISLSSNKNGSWSITVNWNAIHGASEYIIDRRINFGSWNNDYARVSSPTFVNSGLTGIRTYYYRVRAVTVHGNEGGNSSSKSIYLPTL